MHDTFTVDSSFPASLENMPLLAMLTIMSFWVVVLVCLKWLYEIIAIRHERPAPKSSYVRIARNVRFWLLFTILWAAVPRLLQLMLWQDLNPDAREILSLIAWAIRIPSAAMFVYAYWANRALVATETVFVEQNGFIYVPKIDRAEKNRALTALAIIFVVSFATTFVRAAPDAHQQRPAIERG